VSTRQYIVDGETGIDENSGQSPEDAFKTIGRCLDEVRTLGGDCLVRQGRYREQLKLSSVKEDTLLQPVRIVGYEDEEPVWDGTYPIKPNTWIVEPKTGACTATLDRDIFALFLDDDLLTPARWPNALWSDKTVFLVDHWRPEQKGSDRGLVVDDRLAESGLDMTGAMAILNIGSWETFVAKVEKHEKGSNKFSYNDIFGDIKFKVKNNHYYLEGSLALLDGPEEWFYDSNTRLLRVIPPQGKTCEDLSNLRGRIIDYGLVIEDSEKILISNFTFFGTNIAVDNSRDVHLDSTKFLFPSSSHRMLGSAHLPYATRLYGDSISVTNCVFHGGEGPAIDIRGSHSNVFNNLFSYNDWAVQGNIGTVVSKTVSGKFSYNSLFYNGAAHGLRYTGRGDEISMNHIEGTCWGSIQNDGASIQVSPGGQNGVNIHHNWVHNSPKKGIRFDGNGVGNSCGRNGYLGYNVGWGITRNSEIFPKGDNHTVEHNTAFDTDTDCSLCVISRLHDSPMNENSVVVNNAASKMSNGGGVIKDNFEDLELTDYLVDVQNLDFRPLAGSPLILNNGGYIGAYSPHEEDYYWIPGHRTLTTSGPIPRDGGFLSRDRVEEDSVMCIPGYLAQRHHFYFGVNRDSVQEAGLDDPEFQYSTQDGQMNVFWWGSGVNMEHGREYFWRVDAEKNGQVYKGEVWMFRT